MEYLTDGADNAGFGGNENGIFPFNRSSSLLVNNVVGYVMFMLYYRYTFI